jgi:hypothetical protein
MHTDSVLEEMILAAPNYKAAAARRHGFLMYLELNPIVNYRP